jgi:hypothetical protein
LDRCSLHVVSNRLEYVRWVESFLLSRVFSELYRSETDCIGLYHTAMSWSRAVAVCRATQAELISFRRTDIVQLLYQSTSDKRHRRGAVTYEGWTSAHTTDLKTDLYQWLDLSVQNITSNSSWWCRKSTANLGYVYTYDEPTKFGNVSEAELCVMYRRGQSVTPVVCLDDQPCIQSLAFVCEKCMSIRVARIDRSWYLCSSFLAQSTAEKYNRPARSYLLLT